MDEVTRVREFNRAVTRRLGVLEDRFLGRSRPLGAARLLFEIGHEGAEVRQLRTRLGLDSGYVSRMLRDLEREGLVEVGTSPGDGRVRVVRLTGAGGREVDELDRRSDAFAAAMLEPLTPAQRERLVTAMGDVERLLLASTVTIAPADAAGADARWCLGRYFAELAERFDTGFDPGQSLPFSAADFTPPAGVFLMATADGGPVGCAALKVTAPGTGYIKRMWVAPRARGSGLGRRILDALEAQAADMGLTTLQLETNRTLTEAIALYRARGYREVAPFNDEPYADHWFEKRLPAT
jgi:DNA-binding MarR family transcriptional regulator/N-acetylglutamate synthase-like GNAT family acetyltransferase